MFFAVWKRNIWFKELHVLLVCMKFSLLCKMQSKIAKIFEMLRLTSNTHCYNLYWLLFISFASFYTWDCRLVNFSRTLKVMIYIFARIWKIFPWDIFIICIIHTHKFTGKVNAVVRLTHPRSRESYM